MYDLTSARKEEMQVEGHMSVLGCLKFIENVIDILLIAIERVDNIGMGTNVGPGSQEARQN